MFDFLDFAREIYSENPDIYVEPLRIEKEDRFLLPALYGGEAGRGETNRRFKALVVLQDPLVSFTRELWKTKWTTRCTTPEEAVSRHREIFFDWAFKKRERAELFRTLIDKPSTFGDFFRRVYVTDIWKDAALRKNRKRGYEGYWRSKLAIEINSIPTERVIFVGAEAGRYGCDYVPPGTPKHFLVFPSWRNPSFQTEVRQLQAEIHGERLIEDLSNGPPESQLKDEEAGVGFAVTDHDWTLNNEINHNKFGVIPINEPRIQMNLLYQRCRKAGKVPVGSFPLDMNDLLRNDLVREVDKGGKRGFWLRFVHDLANNGIYIQLNGHSPSRFVAKVPAGAL